MEPDKAKVARTIHILESLHQDMERIAARKEQNWKFEMVKMRRDQSLHLGALAKELDAWLPQLSDSDATRKTQIMFSEMRHAISMTQTQWPLSMIDGQNASEKYRVATEQTIEKSNLFFIWIKKLLA